MYDKIYGKKFKQLREEKRSSLETTSRSITSKSSLYYWEKGMGDMSFSKVIKMLERLHIKPEEFLANSLNAYLDISDISTAYLENNYDVLRSLAKKYLTISRQSPTSRRELIRAAIACHHLMAATGENLFLSQDLEKLEELLSQIDEWYYEDVYNFGNTLSLLPSNRIYGLTKLLIKKLSQNQQKAYDQWQHSAWNTCLNAIFTLFYRKFAKVKKLVTELDAIEMGYSFIFEKVRLKFAHEVMLYIQTGDETRMLQVFFPFLDYLGTGQLAADLKKSFKRIKKIYTKKTI